MHPHCRPFSRALLRRTLFISSSTARGSPALKYFRNGLLCSVIAVGVAVILPRPPVRLDADRAQLLTPEPCTIDPDTSISFPNSLKIPSKHRLPPFTLLGVGVRRVSFLRVKVYSVAFYADLSNPALNIPADASPDEKIAHIIANTACVLRIIPTRNTSYSHLRDGFMRALHARLSLCLTRGTLSVEDADRAQGPLRKLKSIFPTTSLQKHIPLDIFLAAPSPAVRSVDKNKVSGTGRDQDSSPQERSLVFRDLGGIESDWVAREFVMSYFEGDGISPPMKKSVLATLEN